MHFASELSYPFIWYSKTSKQLEVLMKVLTLKMFIFIQLLLRLCLLGSPLTSCVGIIPIPGHMGSRIKDNESTGFG